jgi:hypothetical protein
MNRSLTLVLLILLSAVAPAAAAADQQSMECLETHSGTESDVADIRASVTQSPNASDTVRITYDTRTLDGDFGVMPPRDTEVIATQGFSYSDDEHRYQYSGGERPFIEYRIGVDGERRQYASGDTWIFAPAPTHIGVGVNLHPRPSGVIGDKFLYLGNYTKYTTSTGCHDIGVIVADQGDLGESPTEILDALQYTAAEHDVDHRYESVRIFATPGYARPGSQGFAEGNETWVTTSLPPDFTGSHTRLFVHEYIHTRQAFGGNELRSMAWFNEGIADYYSYKLLREQGTISSDRYNQWLQNGSQMDGQLTDPSTWENRYVGYAKSGAFFAVLDAKIQNTPNASLEDVVRRVNYLGGVNSHFLVQRSQFLDAVGNVSTNETVAWANTTVSTDTTLDVSQATVPRPGLAHWIQSQSRERIAEEPFAAVFTAFFAGMLIIMLLNEIGRNESEQE